MVEKTIDSDYLTLHEAFEMLGRKVYKQQWFKADFPLFYDREIWLVSRNEILIKLGHKPIEKPDWEKLHKMHTEAHKQLIAILTEQITCYHNKQEAVNRSIFLRKNEILYSLEKNEIRLFSSELVFAIKTKAITKSLLGSVITWCPYIKKDDFLSVLSDYKAKEKQPTSALIEKSKPKNPKQFTKMVIRLKPQFRSEESLWEHLVYMAKLSHTENQQFREENKFDLFSIKDGCDKITIEFKSHYHKGKKIPTMTQKSFNKCYKRA